MIAPHLGPCRVVNHYMLLPCMTSCLNLEGRVDEGALQYKGNSTADDVRHEGKARPIPEFQGVSIVGVGAW